MSESKQETTPFLPKETEGNSQEEYKKQLGKTVFAVSFYMIVSVTLVFLNRLVLSDPKDKAGALFTSWYQFVVTYVIIILISFFGQNVPLLNIFPKLNYKFDILIKVLPVSITYVLQVGLNNKCLEYVSVSGYQVVRSLTIMFNIILTYFILHQTTSVKACLCCLGVIIGFFIGVDGDVSLSVRGCIYGVLSSLCVASYSIAVKKALKYLNNNQYVLIEYNTPVAILILIPFVYHNGEFEVFSRPHSPRFWFMQTFAGVVGFVINIAIFLDIQVTSPLTHNLAGTVKAALQTILAYFIFPNSETISFKKFTGIFLIISFSGLYGYVRNTEMKSKNETEKKPNDHLSYSNNYIHYINFALLFLLVILFIPIRFESFLCSSLDFQLLLNSSSFDLVPSFYYLSSK